jgi:YD repeat-containing protein
VGVRNHPSKTHRYTYDQRGNKNSFTDPQGTKFTYDYNNSQLQTIHIPNVGNIHISAYQWQAPNP